MRAGGRGVRVGVVVALACLVSVAPAAGATPAAALQPVEPQPVEPQPVEHCVAVVVGQHPDGEFVLSEIVCHEERATAVRSARAAHGTARSMAIGIHYDLHNLGGSSFTVMGDNCLGGYLNMSAAWDNRVSSTLGGCPRIRHWTGANKTGSAQDTLPHGNLAAPVNNAVSSIQYMT